MPSPQSKSIDLMQALKAALDQRVEEVSNDINNKGGIIDKMIESTPLSTSTEPTEPTEPTNTSQTPTPQTPPISHFNQLESLLSPEDFSALNESVDTLSFLRELSREHREKLKNYDILMTEEKKAMRLILSKVISSLPKSLLVPDADVKITIKNGQSKISPKVLVLHGVDKEIIKIATIKSKDSIAFSFVDEDENTENVSDNNE